MPSGNEDPKIDVKTTERNYSSVENALPEAGSLLQLNQVKKVLFSMKIQIILKPITELNAFLKINYLKTMTLEVSQKKYEKV